MITLDGITIESFGLIAQPGHQHGPPPSVDRFVHIPERDGVYDFGSDNGPGDHSIPLSWAQETSRASLQSKIRTFSAFTRDANGKYRNMVLRYDYEPEKYYTVRYSGQWPIERVLSLGFFTFPLIAADPYAYAEDTAFDEAPGEYDTELEYDSGLMYENPESFNWIYTEHSSGVYNYSKLTTPLIVTITGTVTNPSITNQDTGKTIAITYALSGQTLVIDGKRMTVTIDGVNAMQYVSGDFVNLVEGSNGLFFSGTSPNATATYGWLHKFL